MKVLAKDAKAGQWYKVVGRGGDRVLCCNQRRFWTPHAQAFQLGNDVELTHLPDCDGWDWQPPKPEKKYRPFANAAEFIEELRHRPYGDRFYRHNSESSDIHQPIGRFHDNALDGEPWDTLLAEYVWCNGTPFGLEVTE
jgi:hypothetical protein